MPRPWEFEDRRANFNPYPGWKIEAGVEVLTPFEETELVRRSATPAGEVVTTTHWGEYSAMQPAYKALEDSVKQSGRSLGDVSWEVYGHWSDDPTNRRTDIYWLLRA